MEWYHVYLFTRLESIGFILGAGFILLCIAALIILIVAIASGGELFTDNGFLQDHWKKLAYTTAVFLFLCVAVPTQKEAAAIYLLPKLAKSDFAKEAGQIPADAAKLMRLKLESWIADMEPAAKK